MANKPLRTLYDSLKANNYDVPADYGSFERTLTAPGKQGVRNRQTLYQSLKANNYDVPDTYESFSRTLFAPVNPGMSQLPGDVAERRVRTSTPQQTHPLDKGKARRRLQAQQQAIENQQKRWEQDNKRFKEDISRREQRLPGGMDRFEERAKEQLATGEAAPVPLAPNDDVVRGDIAFNPQTGRMQQTYTTPEGGTFFDRNQAQFDHSLQTMPDDEIGMLELERELIGSGILRRGRELDKEYQEQSWFDRLLAGFATDPEMGPGPRERMAEEDEELQSLLTAWRKNRDALRILYDERDNNMNSFWHNFGTTVANGYTFTGGRAELHDAQAILNSSKRMDEIQRKMDAGEKLSNVENAALSLANNTAWDNAIQAMYGDDYGAWATAGGAAVQSLEMMPEFIAGMPVLKGLGSAAIKLLTRNAANGLGRFMLKGLGMTLGTMAGGAVMANTIQAERTLGKAAGKAAGSWWFGDDGEFMLGHYDGDQFVSGGESLAAALFHAEQEAIPEAASEGAGEFLPGIGQVLSKIGLSRIAKPLATLSGKGWYKTYQNMLRAAGWHGVGGEALEEYVGTLDGLIMGDVEGVKRLADPRTHFDIWLSCATLGPLLNAPVVLGSSMRGVYSPVAYHKLKAAVTRQDKIASFRLTEDRWAPWRERIDATPNEQMTDLMVEVRDSKDLAPQEKKAIFDYVKALQGYRGWNLGEYIFGKDAEEEGNGKTDQEQQQSQEYSNGYETVTPEERRAAKDRLDVARARLESKGYTEQWMQWVESTPIDDVMSDLTERGLAGDTEAVTEYLHAKAAYDGMLARVNDDIDDDVAVAGEAIEQRVAPENAGGDGMIHPAALKDGREVFIVSGNVATLADNSIDVENSDSMIIVRDADGQLHNITPSDIESLGEVQDPAQQRQQVEQEITDQQIQAAAAQIEGALPFNVGDQYTINYQGQPHTYQVVNADENSVAVLVDGAQEPVVLTKQQLQQMADEEHAQQIQAQAVATDTVEEPAEEPSQSDDTVDQAVAPVTEEAPAAPAAPEDNPTAAMPMDDQGEPAWYQVEPERGHQYLYQESGWPQAMADNFVQARIDDAEKALKKAQDDAQKLIDKPKKTFAENNAAVAETNAALQAAQAALDYWNAVKAIQAQATAHVVEEAAPAVETPAEQEPTEQAAPVAEAEAPAEPEATSPAVEKEQPEQSLDAAVAEAEQITDTNPTDAQKESGNYRKGHVTIEGLDISIEQPKGSVRSGVDADGHEWSQEMHNTYGYIRGTEGVDGDHIDVFLSDHLDDWNGLVFVVDQVNKDGSFDEHKVMLGFNSTNEAKDAYLSNYKEGWTGLGDITVINIFDFKDWINSSHRKTKPFAEYKIALENAILDEEESEQPAAPVAENEMQPVEEPTADNGGAAAELSPEMKIVQEAKSRYPGENRIVILHYGDHYKVFNEDAERLHEALGDEFPITEMGGEGGIDKVMVITPEQIGEVLPAAIKAGLRVPLMRQAPAAETAQSEATEDQAGAENAPQSDAVPEQPAGDEGETTEEIIQLLKEEFADVLDESVEIVPESVKAQGSEYIANVTVDGEPTNIWLSHAVGSQVNEHYNRIFIPLYDYEWHDIDELAIEYNALDGKVCEPDSDVKRINFKDVWEATQFEGFLANREEEEQEEQQAEAESSVAADIQYSIEHQGDVPMGNKQKKFDIAEANKSGDVNQPAISQGVYHDPSGYAVSTDGHILVADKRAYDEKNKGKLIASKKVKKSTEVRKGTEIKEPIEKGQPIPIERYPKWKSVKVNEAESETIKLNFNQFADWLAGVEVRMKEQWQQWKNEHPDDKMSFNSWRERSKIQILTPDGNVRWFKFNELQIFARAAADQGAKALRYYPNNTELAIQADSKNGFVLLMPLANLDYYNKYLEHPYRIENGLGVDLDSSLFTYDMSNGLTMPGKTATGRVELNYESGKDAESRAYIEEVMEREGWDEDAKSEFRKILDDAADLVSRMAQGFTRLREWNNKKLTDEQGNYNPLWRVWDDKNGWIPTRSSFKKNGEYPYNIDLGALCTKREAFDAVVRYIKEQGWGQNLGPTQIEALKSLLREHGFLTACDICFNETKRARALDYGNAVAYYWNAVRQAVGIDDDLPIGTPRELTEEQTKILTALAASKNGKAFSKYIPKEVRRTYETYINSKGKRKRREADKGLTPTMTAKIAKLFLQDPSLMGRFDGTTLLSTDSVDALVRQYPHTTIAEFIAGAWGSATPKPNEGFNIYDPLSWKQSYDKKRQRPSMEWFFNLGGFRAQSFSDYHPIFFYDYVQMFTDLAIRRLPIHIYTKVPALIKLFGGTGAKFNMSLVPEVVQGVDAEHLGLKPDGKGGWELAWHEDSFPVDEAFALRQDPRFKGNVGTIAVGISDAHIRMLLDDPRIDMVIPYHKSGMPKSVQIKTGLNNATDYTDDQNTKGKKKGLKDFSFNEALRRLGDPRKAADEYLAWCKQNKCTPKFPQFADHPNYYKVLEDFRCIDNEGNYSPQQPVQVSFFDDVEQRLSESLEDKTMQEGLDNAIRGNDAITEGIEKIMSKPRLDGKIRDMMLARLKQVLGMNNVASLKQEDFFEELQKVYTDQMGAERAQQQVEVLRTSGGIVYGFAVGNRIVLNENYFNAETPMHEFTHVWVKVARLANPQMWAEGKELLKQTKEWQEVMSDEFYRDIQGDEDAVASEVLARIVGQDAARQINEMFAPEDKPQERPGIYNKIKQWVSKFLDGVRSLFSDNAKGLTYDELVRMPMKALFDDAEASRFMEALQQVNEEDVDLSSQGSVPTFYSNAARAVENVKQEKAKAEQWKAMLMKQGGIKAGEDKWMGLSTWLDEHKGETLTKDEVLQFVAENGIQMEEVKYSEEGREPEVSVEDVMQSPEFSDMVSELVQYDENEGPFIDNELFTEKAEDDEDFDDGFRISYWGDEIEVNDPVAAARYLGLLNSDDYENAIDDTRLRYTTEGLENKREIAFVVPGVESYQESDEIHFGPENEGRAVMWVRFGETTDTDGNRVLVIDEIQSNRHQDARENGYKETSARRMAERYRQRLKEKYPNGFAVNQDESNRRNVPILSKEELERLNELREAERAEIETRNNDAIPAAPFEKNWHEVAMKRMLRLAAEEGFDKVAWTTGEQQAERYDLSKGVDWIQRGNDYGDDPERIFIKLDEKVEDVVLDENGIIVDSTRKLKEAVGKPLSDVIGRELAEKAMSAEPGTKGRISGEGLKVGGKGMIAFYDGMLPQFMNKYGKRWGVKVGEVTLDTPGKEVMHSVDVTPEMRRSVMTEGQPLFQIKKSKGDQTKSANFKNWFGDWENDPENASKVVDAEGRPLVVYHQTNAKRWINRETGEDWEKLDWRKKMEWENKSQEEWEDAWEEQDFYTFDDRYARQSIEMPAIFFSPENDPHHEYGNRTIAVYLNMRNPAINPDIPNRGVTDTAGRDAMEALKAQGYDGFIRTDEDGNIREYGVFDSNQVKSADEVTFDDEGNEIPEEDRYNPDEQDIRYRELDEDEDAELIERLENGPHITTYSTKIKSGDGYVPPMSSKDNETGEMRAPEHEQKWNESEERPDLAKQDKKTGKWKFDLKKSNDKDVNGVLYNPYNHSGSGMLNDQFSEAQDRDDLVVVEQVVPQSEETDKYKAEKANDPTGWKAWKAGPITAKMTGKRKVFLSRWHKITRVVPWSEVADAVAKDLGDQFDVLPTNPFPPQLRAELEKKGYKFVKTDNKCVIQEGEYKGATWSERYYDVYPDRAKSKDKREKGARAKAVKDNNARRRVEEMGQRLGVKVTIVDDMSEQERDGMSKKMRRAKGWYDVRTGQVFINLGNHRTVSDIEATFLHEVVAHKGLRRLFGDEFDKFLHNVYYNVDASIREEINRLMAKNNWDYREATEEYLAKLAQQMNFERPDRYLKAWDTVARLFRQLLQKMGLGNGMNLKDSDLQGILFESYHNMEKEGVAGLAESVEFRDAMEREANRRVDNATYETAQPDVAAVASEPNGDQTKEDRDYMDAVESGDMDKAARMVEKAAKRAMPDTKIKDKNGNPVILYHGTFLAKTRHSEYGYESIDDEPFYVFETNSISQLGAHFGTRRQAENRAYSIGLDASNDHITGEEYLYSVYLDIHNPIELTDRGKFDFEHIGRDLLEDGYITEEEYDRIASDIVPDRAMKELLKSKGYDGAVYFNEYEGFGISVIAFEPNQIKSAEPATRDDNGNVIPLSERFNPEKEDIRFRDDEDELEDFEDSEDFYEEELEEEAENAEDLGEEVDDSEAGESTFQEMMLGKMLQAANSAGAAQSARVSAMRSLGGALQQIRKAMSAQRNYDRDTVNTIVRLAREVMASGYFNDLTRGEVKRLLAAAKNVNGSANVTEQANKVVDTLLRHHLRECENLLKKQLKVKGSKTNPSGVEVQAGLDIEGQRMTTAMKQGIRLDEPGLRQRVAECLSRMGSSDPVVSSVASQEYTGLMLAQQYHDTIKKSRQEEQNMREEMRQVKAEFAAHRDSLSPDELKRERQALKDYIAATEDAIRQNRMERADAYNQLSEMLGGGIASSMERAKQWREQQRERVGDIQHNANSDLEGVPADEHMKPTWKHRMANWAVVRFFMKPLATFDYMLRMMGQKSPNGEGYLWNRFMGGWVEANDKEWRNVKAAHQVLDDKVKEVFGRDIPGLPKFKVKRWSDLFFIERKMKGMDVDFWDDDQIKTHTLTPGNLLYIYMVNKMSDGKMKLRKMGISEEDVEAIKNHLDPRLIELADWLQDEFLVQKRVEYNAVHERMFGAPMAAIENYFPLKINDRSRSQEEDVNNQDANPDDNRGSTITGAIIKRVRNNKALDVTGADAFDVILEHIQTMEHWAAFAEFNRDLNTLLSYKRFRNRMLNMASARFGSGKKLWTNFKRVCAIASGVYRPKVDYDSVDTNLVNVAKGVTRAKISFRFYTALKQLLSYPAYLSTANPIELAKSSNPVGAFKAWNWAIDNLPGFAERWQSRQAGDTRLKESDADWGLWKSKIIDTASRWGMSPNAFIDALTVAMGAKAIYETKFKQYKKLGYPEEQAKRRAQRDASVAYNETQQSSANAYTSAMQLDRTAASVALTVFRNASMGYQRRLFQSFANLKHMGTKGYRAQSLEYLAKQMERDGLDKPTAEAAANKVYNRTLFQNIADVAIFGWVMQAAWNLGAYLPYLFMGDDDDDKKDMLTDAALHAIAGGVEGLTGGSVISDTYNSIRSGDAKATYSNELLPLLSDIESLKRTFKKDVIEGANDLVNLIVQAGVGVNPQTITDWVVAGLDMANGDPELANEWGLLVMRVMSAPQGQLDQLYIDELGMTAGDARKLNAEEFAQRYARYKMGRESTFTGWAYSEQGHNDAVDRYVKNFGKKVKERLVGKDIATLDDAFERGDGYMKDIVGKAIKTRLEEADDSELPTIYKYTTNEVTKKTTGREMAKRIAKNEDLDDYFDKQRDPVLRKAAASEIAKRLGTQDYAGKAPQAKWTQETKDAHERYQDLRTAADVNEDCQVTLLKVSDDDKAELREIKKQLGQGGDDNAIMQEYREARAEILKRYK